ncbi:hypothetical protein DSCO28_55300 [Desulfosarcina ovata subsp. sediminis]|uniref:Uncharacterized protein n=1 Tax=Desulfosarcina ovata subsp. sediminis TaxID=885957 RepID=A0A5K7ZXS8_9BACT|nr:hypothetical protein DSCO28_55300 [Desulfosarcina ovata subsp. sediminis]
MLNPVYGNKLGNTAALAVRFQSLAKEYIVNLYGRYWNVMAYEREGYLIHLLLILMVS